MQQGNRAVQSNGVAGNGLRGRPRPSTQALQQAEQLAESGCWEWDLESDLLLWSDNMFRLLGLEPGEIEPTPEEVIARTHPDDRERVRAEVEAARRMAKPPDLTYRVIWPDGTVRVLRGATAAEETRDGRPSKLVGSMQDLTELVAAQRETAESVNLLEALAAAPIGFAFVDRDLRVARINEAMARTSSLPREQQIGRSVAELAPEAWDQIEPALRHVLDGGEPVLNLGIERTAESETTPGPGHRLASYYPVVVDGEVIGVGVVVIDITERAKAERLRLAVMDTMMEGLCVLDGEGRLSFMNASASRLLGWSEEELRGSEIHDAVHFQYADGTPHPVEECELLKVRTERRAVRMSRDSFTRKDGTIFPVSYSAAPLLEGSSVLGVVVVFRDISSELAEEERVQRELDTLVWVGRVRDALDEDRLTLYSQPIVPLRGGRPAEELLLRMLGPRDEVIAPNAFLPVAERYGLITEIDEWAIRHAAEIAASGRRVDVNLSAESIGSLDLLPRVERELRRAGADPANLVFEITETALMKDLEAGEAFAQHISSLGCQVALDDFGTGFGSFTYLKKLPITYLKIDIDFVRDLLTHPASQHLVKAIVGLASDFGYKTIAEGVEDGETLALLADYGVDFAQGFYLGRPAPDALA